MSPLNLTAMLEAQERKFSHETECEHTDVCDDEFICLNCGADRREAVMALAYDRAKDRRKYGD